VFSAAGLDGDEVDLSSFKAAMRAFFAPRLLIVGGSASEGSFRLLFFAAPLGLGVIFSLGIGLSPPSTISTTPLNPLLLRPSFMTTPLGLTSKASIPRSLLSPHTDNRFNTSAGARTPSTVVASLLTINPLPLVARNMPKQLLMKFLLELASPIVA